MSLSSSLQTAITNHTAPQDATLQCCVLSNMSLISVAGPDAQKFLQGQLTCDINALDATNSSRGAHCTPKGRAIASFTVAQATEANYLFALPSDNTEALSKALGKYIVFSKAKIEPKADWAVIGIQGEGAQQFATGFESSESAVIVNRGDNRYQLWAEQTLLAEKWSVLFAQAQIINEQAWHKADIEQGLCDIVEATREEFIPQMFGLKEDDGISYKKGCYTGQEIVARLHFLGQQKRSLFHFTTEATVSIGDEVKNQADKSVGAVAAFSEGQGLAVLSKSAQEDELNINGNAIAATLVTPEPEAS